MGNKNIIIICVIYVEKSFVASACSGAAKHCERNVNFYAHPLCLKMEYFSKAHICACDNFFIIIVRHEIFIFEKESTALSCTFVFFCI